MATSTDIHINDVGTTFLVTIVDNDIPVDLSSGSSNLMLFLKPDGTFISRPAVFNTNGTDGVIKYTTVDGDLDQQGYWSLGAVVTTSSGKWTATAVQFMVRSTFS